MKHLFFLLMCLLPFHAQAAGVNYFGEIYLGTDNSNLKATAVTAPDYDGKVSGGGVAGARGGTQFGPLMAGVEIMGTLGNLNFNDESLKDGTWNKTATFVFAGLDLNLIRLYGAWAVMHETKLSQTTGILTTETKFTGGNFYKYGASIRLFKGLHLNAETYVHSPRQLEVNSVKSELSDSFTKFDETGYMITLSWVFENVKRSSK